MNTAACLNDFFQAALRAADPAHCLLAHLPDAPAHGRTVVVGAGKAAAAMARVVDQHWPAAATLSGTVITRYGHGYPKDKVPTRIEVIEAAHPVPDAAGVAATQRILDQLQGLDADDLVLVLLSGGGSALLSAPLPGLTLDDKRALTRQLLHSGASISEINCVRRHLSAVKGGRLTQRAAPARVVTLAISDVPGDDLAAIASGPTVPDPSSCADALAILERYRIEPPASVLQLLKVGAGETAKPGDPCFARSEAHMIATAQGSLQAAAQIARDLGITPVVLGDRIEGEAREVARVLAGMALSCAEHGAPERPPCVLLSGGETTVTVRNPQGRGGRNSEFLLALGLALDGHPRIHALAADTDGIDGSEDNAGAMLDPSTLTRLCAAGLDPRQLLDNNESYRGFATIGDLLMTGPTRTNVNDFRAILIL